MNITDRDLLYTLQIALLGSVTPHLRAVTVGYPVENQIVLRFYYDGLVSEDDRETVSCVETEILARFWWEGDPLDVVDWMAVRQDSPELIDWANMLVYHRYEENFQLLREPFPCPKLNSLHPSLPDARLVLIRALLGAVTPELRRVYVQLEVSRVRLFFYYHGPLSSLAHEMALRVSTFVVQHIDDGIHPEIVELNVERLDFPELPPIDTWCVYSKFEPYVD